MARGMELNWNWSNLFSLPNGVSRGLIYSNLSVSVLSFLFLFYLYLRIMYISELSTGRMDPRVGSGRVRVGSGHDFAGFWRVGSGQNLGFFIFTYYFLVPESI